MVSLKWFWAEVLNVFLSKYCYNFLHFDSLNSFAADIQISIMILLSNDKSFVTRITENFEGNGSGKRNVTIQYIVLFSKFA